MDRQTDRDRDPDGELVNRTNKEMKERMELFWGGRGEAGWCNKSGRPVFRSQNGMIINHLEVVRERGGRGGSDRERGRERERERETDRQTDRQTHRHTDRQKEKGEREREIKRERKRER